MKGTGTGVALATLAVVGLSSPASAQLDLGGVIQRAAESETKQQVDRMTRKAVRCAFNNAKCIEKAKKKGKPVVLTDENGQVMTDDQGNPITDPAELGGKPPGLSSGTTGSDFVPGSRVLFEKNFAEDSAGSFPTDLEQIDGRLAVIEWNGQSYLRAEDEYGRVALPLEERLPQDFTLEFDLFEGTGGRDGVSIAMVEPSTFGYGWTNEYGQDYLNIGHQKTVGIWGPAARKIVAKDEARPSERVVPVKIRVEGEQVEMYVGNQQVVRADADLGRSDKIYLFLDALPPDNLTYIANIRVAAIE